MSVEPISLQNLFLHSDQLSKDIAQQAQAGYLQQDEMAHKSARQQQEQDTRVHEIEKNEDETLNIDDDTASDSGAQGEDKDEQSASDSAAPKKAISEDYLGQQIDICK